MINRKEIACDYGKKWLAPHECEFDWKGEYCYKCKSKDNLESLTQRTWWVYYYRCNNCNTIYYYNEGDKIGGQCDTISYASQKDIDNDLKGEYRKYMLLKD